MLKTDRKRKNRGNLLTLLTETKPGQSFYTDILPKGVTAYCAIYGHKVSTEILLCVSPKSLKVERLTKVTIL
jgi:hypothetical protein